MRCSSPRSWRRRCSGARSFRRGPASCSRRRIRTPARAERGTTPSPKSAAMAASIALFATASRRRPPTRSAVRSATCERVVSPSHKWHGSRDRPPSAAPARSIRRCSPYRRATNQGTALRRAASNALALWAPSFAVRTELLLAGARLRGVPGEMVGSLALAAAPQHFIGLADGYLGYVEDPARALRGEGEASRTYYGPGLARALGVLEER